MNGLQWFKGCTISKTWRPERKFNILDYEPAYRALLIAHDYTNKPLSPIFLE